MSEHKDEFEARGPSTRPVQLRGEDYLVRFTEEALAGAVDQVRSGFVKMTVEHLSYLPPIGHWHRAEVATADDGHSELVMYGHRLPTRRALDTALPEEPPDGPPGPESIPGVRIGLEPRNFDGAVWRTLTDNSPLPVHEQAAWSTLPPLIWLISIPVTWGVVQFAGGFLKRLGEAAGDGLASWIRANARQARDNSRDNLVEVQFEIAGNLTVSGFIPFNAHTANTVDELRKGLDGLGPLASFAGWLTGGAQPSDVRLVAFIYQDDDWNLAWWASPDNVYVTEWFEKNCPDPKRFLGRPIFDVADRQSDGDRRLVMPPEYE